jgi:hypothetical protein
MLAVGQGLAKEGGEGDEMDVGSKVRVVGDRCQKLKTT